MLENLAGDPSNRNELMRVSVLPYFFFFFFFYCLLSRSISDHYLRSCENVTCSRPQRKAPRLRIEPGTSGTGVNHSTTAPVRSIDLWQFLCLNISSPTPVRPDIATQWLFARVHTSADYLPHGNCPVECSPRMDCVLANP